MEFIDIHTHRFVSNKFSIYNTFLYKEIPIEDFQSIGLHPWHFNEINIGNELKSIEQSICNCNVLAIGECGLDKICKTDFGLQTEVFEKLISISEKYKKPLLIHCVKAYNEILNLRKKSDLNIPWIIHGFNENQDIAKKLNDKNIYLSVGKLLFDEKSRIHKSFTEINLEYLFFETDDADYQINEIYEFASKILNLNQNILISKIAENFKKVFE